MKAAIYIRKSTMQQNSEYQERLCREFCDHNGHEIYKVYSDTITGGKDSRPAFNELQDDMRHYRFNCVIVTKLDRIGRSLQHILSLFDEFTKLGVHFIAITQSIDTSSPQGKFQLQMLGAFAEFERNIISERTKEALQFKKNVGKRGPDKKPRKKRGGIRTRLNMVKNDA